MIVQNYLSPRTMKILSWIFFVLLFLVGIVIHRDFGGNWDEDLQRKTGQINVAYLEGTSDALLNDKEKYHGPAFEILLIYLEEWMDLTDSRNIYMMRHFVTFLSYFLAVIALYFLIYERFRDWGMSLLGCLFFVLSPRLFADAFHNVKDIPFLSFFTIAMLFLIKALRHKKIVWAILAGVFAALAISIRVLGILIPLFFIIGAVYQVILDRAHLKKLALLFLIFLLVSIPVLIFSWPILLHKPLFHFVNAFEEMSQFPWGGYNLYFGEFIRATELPWHYLPVWISITTPLVFLMFFLTGLIYIIVYYVRNIKYPGEIFSIDLLVLMWFFAPILAVIFLKSVVYDGWRHVFFLYPAFIIIALFGLRFIWSQIQRLTTTRNFVQYCFIALISLTFLDLSLWMIRYHPYQMVYFSQPLRSNMYWTQHNFEMDYYGLAYKQGLEYILEKDDREIIRVKVTNWPGKFNHNLLFPDQRARFRFVDEDFEADYLLTNLRGISELHYEEFHSIKVGKGKIQVIYKMD